MITQKKGLTHRRPTLCDAKGPTSESLVLSTTAAAAALPSAVAFATFKDLCLFGNREHPQLVQLEYFLQGLDRERTHKRQRTLPQDHGESLIPFTYSETCMPIIDL
jgi:hypothetical protein